jgi:hypothetical protein
LGEWQLDEDAVDRRVVIEARDLFEKLGFGDGLGQLEKFAINTCLEDISWVTGGGLRVGFLPPWQLSISYEHRLLKIVRVFPAKLYHK